MNIEGKYPNGLATAMKRSGMTNYAELGRLIGKPRQDIERWAKGKVRLTRETAEALSPHVGATVLELLYPDMPSTGRVPLISWVSAGALAMPRTVLEPGDVLDWLPLGLADKGDWIALRVEGDSMDRISPPESVILVNRRDKRLVTNACYIIADADGATTYKRYRADPPRWEPVSTNPRHDPTFVVSEDNKPLIVGRVRRTILDM